MAHLTLTLTGLQVIPEYNTITGRMDDVLFDGNTVFIFEYKLDKSARVALDQIRSKKYYLPLQLAGKQIIGVGINFDSKTKSISEWLTEPIPGVSPA